VSRVLLALSGLSALAASALFAWRVWTAPVVVPPTAPPAVYAPTRTPPVVRPGEVFERETPATGFILLIEAEPEAQVTIDGKESGETPASLNFECQPGQKYAVRLQRAGYHPIERAVTCKKDVMLLLKTRLESRRR